MMLHIKLTINTLIITRKNRSMTHSKTVFCHLSQSI